MKLRLFALVCCLSFLGAAPEEPKPLKEHPRIQAMHKAATRWRSQYGQPEQQLDEELCEMAQRWANQMAAYNSMYHGGGEQVIAYGYPNAQACIQGWVSSPAHAAWVLGGSRRCGFGCQRGSNGMMYWAGVYR